MDEEEVCWEPRNSRSMLIRTDERWQRREARPWKVGYLGYFQRVQIEARWK